MKNLFLTLLCLTTFHSLAQIPDSETVNFQVEFEKFKPSNQDQIREFEGKSPMQFLAPDINGEEQFLGNFKGKTVFIYFFNTDCSVCDSQTATLNLLQEEYKESLKIIAIGDESKEDLIKYSKENGLNYTVLYNGKMLGEAAYGIEMGYPRIFVINDEGTTQHVLPEEAFQDEDRTYLMLSKLYKLVNAK